MQDKDIKNILDSAEMNVSTDSGKLEFEFSDAGSVVFEAESTGLLIETDTTVPAPKSDTDPDNLVSAILEGSEEISEVSSKDDNSDSSSGEFLVPDAFVAEDKFSAQTSIDEGAGIWSTYVPKFTEVSETYRMKNDTRPRPAAKSNERVTEHVSHDDTDPTAELDTADNIGITVNVVARGTSDDEIKTVYKFADPNAVLAPKERPRTLEDEVREIDALMGKTRDVSEITDAENAPVEVQTETESAGSKDVTKTLSDSAIKEANMSFGKATQGASVPAARTFSAPLAKVSSQEFTAPPQRDGIKDRFLDELLSIKVRFFAAALLTVLLLCLENLSVFGVNIFMLLGIPKQTGFALLLDLAFCVGIFCLAIPEVISAVKKAVLGRITSEISLVLSLVVVSVYSISVFFSNVNNYALFGFLFAIHVVATIAASYLKCSAAFANFCFVTTKDTKYGAELKLTRELERENIALDGLVDEYKSKTAVLRRTAFVDGFFENSNKSAERTVGTLTLMAISFGVALIAGVVAFFIQDGFVSLVTAASFVYMLSMPAFSVLSYKLPYYFAAGASRRRGSAILGEATLEDFSETDVIIYEDTEIFGTDDVNIRSFAGDMTKGTRQMSAIFSAVGGPLDVMFSNALDRKCPAATDVVIEEDGISGIVDEHTVLAGSEEFMLRHGATFASEALRQVSSSRDSTKIMYAAEDGIVYAHFRIRYSFSETFTRILPKLRDEKIVPLITSRDPNVSNELIKTLTTGADCIRVLKKNDTDSKNAPTLRRMNTGVVISGEKSCITSALLTAKQYIAFRARILGTELLSMIVGGALGVVLSLGGMAHAPSVALGLWQLLWCIGLGLLSYREFKEQEKDNDI